jgi:hypothetical protein
VSRSQAMNRAATDSGSPPGTTPVREAASAYPESTDARLVAVSQITSSTAAPCDNARAAATASWVLPHASRQFRPPGPERSGTSTVVEPGRSAASSAWPVSGRGT